MKALFGQERRTEFRTHYFPFTEPSIEPYVSCHVCDGAGCPVCRHSGWIELGGSGMVDPKLFEFVGYDPERYSGFAFGLGLERIAMLRHEFPDLRELWRERPPLREAVLMRVPLSWLREYVETAAVRARHGAAALDLGARGRPRRSTPASPTSTATSGTSSSGGSLAADPHPNADRLQLCQVDVGNPDPQQIVCGAWNFGVGATVAVGLPGALLPGFPGPLEERKLRGEVSRGMILAEDEVGLGPDHAGIMLLPDGLEPGTPLADVLPLVDQVLDVTPTMNRPDLLSMVGIAREVAALCDGELRPPEPDDPAGDAIPSPLEVGVEDFGGCPRYIARGFRGVAVGPSPQWLRARLHLAGMRSISNVVDVTNYVMHVWGSPLHAFDRSKLAGGRILVRRAQRGGAPPDARRHERTLDRERPPDHRRRARGRARGDHGRARLRGLRGDDRGAARGGELRADRRPRARPSGSPSAPRGRTSGRRASTRTRPSRPRCSRAGSSSTSRAPSRPGRST